MRLFVFYNSIYFSGAFSCYPLILLAPAPSKLNPYPFHFCCGVTAAITARFLYVISILRNNNCLSFPIQIT